MTILSRLKVTKQLNFQLQTANYIKRLAANRGKQPPLIVTTRENIGAQPPLSPTATRSNPTKKPNYPPDKQRPTKSNYGQHSTIFARKTLSKIAVHYPYIIETIYRGRTSTTLIFDISCQGSTRSNQVAPSG